MYFMHFERSSEYSVPPLFPTPGGGGTTQVTGICGQDPASLLVTDLYNVIKKKKKKNNNNKRGSFSVPKNRGSFRED